MYLLGVLKRTVTKGFIQLHKMAASVRRSALCSATMYIKSPLGPYLPYISEKGV